MKPEHEIIKNLLEYIKTEQDWARHAGITHEAIREILCQLEDESISTGRAVELFRALVLTAAENITATKEPVNACEFCDGLGIMFSPGEMSKFKHEFSKSPTIERCDSCKRFKNDDEALAELEHVWKAHINRMYIKEFVNNTKIEEACPQTRPTGV
jgi:hypothetical protein